MHCTVTSEYTVSKATLCAEAMCLKLQKTLPPCICSTKIDQRQGSCSQETLVPVKNLDIRRVPMGMGGGGTIFFEGGGTKFHWGSITFSVFFLQYSEKEFPPVAGQKSMEIVGGGHFLPQPPEKTTH